MSSETYVSCAKKRRGTEGDAPMTKHTWRADYFANRDDKEPSRTTLISARSETKAADKASATMGGDLRVDVTRTVLAKAAKPTRKTTKRPKAKTLANIKKPA
jgi:hypothetical protein